MSWGKKKKKTIQCRWLAEIVIKMGDVARKVARLGKVKCYYEDTNVPVRGALKRIQPSLAWL